MPQKRKGQWEFWTDLLIPTGAVLVIHFLRGLYLLWHLATGPFPGKVTVDFKSWFGGATEAAVGRPLRVT